MILIICLAIVLIAVYLTIGGFYIFSLHVANEKKTSPNVSKERIIESWKNLLNYDAGTVAGGIVFWPFILLFKLLIVPINFVVEWIFKRNGVEK